MTTRTVNLCFHGIGAPDRDLEPGEAPYWISADLFHAVLDTVVGRDDVRLSFDDSNSSDLEIGLPALLDRGLRGTFFVLAGRFDSRGSLDEDQVRLLAESGMDIGTHGMDHLPWRGLDEAARRRELVEARDAIAAVVGRPVDEAALPLGRYDRSLLRELRALGYAKVHTSDRAHARASSWLQPRFSLVGTDTVTGVQEEVLGRQPVRRRAERAVIGLAKRLR
ncbi:polysaccharide deacetylase family protein [Nocardioides endophyticus]|uniref:Polysaccharide deacetylase family protein n=1 Tax=Nocardioides endophyticus TaxID=1353775 RepID=A0ABP8ZMX0_9ACTN